MSKHFVDTTPKNIELEQMIEFWQTGLTAEGFDDAVLIEEIEYILLELKPQISLDNILKKYYDKGELTEKQRKKLLNFYCLVYCDLFLED